ncbi:MAG: glycosyltransferase family 2 protein [Bacteroidales bacterium]|nr:glycosyltransferase family 2 protein [Bacteroidales bacterium]
MIAVLDILDKILFLLILIPAVYFLIFAVASKRKPHLPLSHAVEDESVVILIPAYKADEVIYNTAKSAIQQNYPSDKYRVQVISDGMTEETMEQLAKIPVEVLPVSFENSSKAKALSVAMQNLGRGAADYVVILDADNIVEPTFVSSIVAGFQDGAGAIQAHRTAKNRDTATAVLDAASEEVNNAVFRSGHVALGLSSALIGSGMAFKFSWFYDNVGKCVTSGEDKELEIMLLRDKVFIDYLGSVYVYDEKTSSARNYFNQRRRWIAAQFDSFRTAVSLFPSAVSSCNLDLVDKLIQWLFLPRMIITVVPVLLALLLTLLGDCGAAKWWCLTVILFLAYMIALPRKQRDLKLLKSLFVAPVLAVMAFVNLFRMRGMKDKFIHTEHTK